MNPQTNDGYIKINTFYVYEKSHFSLSPPSPEKKRGSTAQPVFLSLSTCRLKTRRD